MLERAESMVEHGTGMLGACWSMPEVCRSALWACSEHARSMLGHAGSVLGAWWSVLGACCGHAMGACWEHAGSWWKLSTTSLQSGRRSRSTICGASRECEGSIIQNERPQRELTSIQPNWSEVALRATPDAPPQAAAMLPHPDAQNSAERLEEFGSPSE